MVENLILYDLQQERHLIVIVERPVLGFEFAPSRFHSMNLFQILKIKIKGLPH